MLDSQLKDSAEFDSALFDGEDLALAKVELDDEQLEHMENWSLIGATLRNELPSKINLDFASGVMAKLEAQEDQALVSQKAPQKSFTQNFNFKKLVFTFTQLAAAACVALVTIVGYQIFNADNNLNSESFAVNVNSVDGVNLASYQNAENSNTITLEQNNLSSRDRNANELANSKNLKEKQQQALEVERINNYIRGYVFDTAAK